MRARTFTPSRAGESSPSHQQCSARRRTGHTEADAVMGHASSTFHHDRTIVDVEEAPFL